MEQIQKLITRVINGDTQAFEEIYQATYRQVYYTAFSFLISLFLFINFAPGIF